MLFGGLRAEGRTTGVKLVDMGVGVFSLSTDFSLSFSRPLTGVEGLVDFSGDLVELMESRLGAASSKRLRSRTLLGCRVWVRLWGLVLDTSDRSGEESVIRLVNGGISTFSRAFSLSAACADCIAGDVPIRDVLGDCGFNGKGAGALSGSELSHLRLVSRLYKRAASPVTTRLVLDGLHGNQSSSMIR